MAISQALFPKQRLSFKEKSADDFQWAKNMLDMLSRYAPATDQISSDGQTEYNRMLANYQLYNNILNQKDFERECNPLGLDVGQFKDNIQPYNKTYNKIQVLLGEELKRRFNFRAILTNSEGIKLKQSKQTLAVRQLIEKEVSDFMAELQQMFSKPNPTEEDMQRIQQQMESLTSAKDIEQASSTSYLEDREMLANEILQYLFHAQSIKEKMNDGFKHGLIAGKEIYWVGVRNGEPVVDPINPLGFFGHKSPDIKYYQDGLYAGYQTMMSTVDIIDNFQETLKEEDIKKLEGPLHSIRGADSSYMTSPKMVYDSPDLYQEYASKLITNDIGQYGPSSFGQDYAVTHVEWRSFKKVFFITTSDPYGEEQVTIVNEDFQIPAGSTKLSVPGPYNSKKTVYKFQDITIEERWIPEIWEGVKIGEDIYTAIGPKQYQFRSMDDPYNNKLGYHGVATNATNANGVSMMDRMKPFQYLFFIVAHKLKRLIARDKGQVFHLDLSMIPEKLGLEKTLYYLEEMDLDLFNPLQNAESPGAYQRGKVAGSTDRSNMQHIMNYISLMDALDAQISDVAGITRQREGQTSPTEAVTNSQQNIIQSATITEVYFHPHYAVWKEVLSSLLQITQECWKHKSVKKQYVLPDLSLSTLDVTPDGLVNSDFGVFVSDYIRDNEVFDTLRTLSQALLQNDKAKMSDIVRMIKTNSIEKLEQEIIQSEKEAFQQQQQMQQAQLDQQAQIEKARTDLMQQQMNLEASIAQLQANTQITLKQMDIDASSQDSTEDSSKELLPIEIEKIRTDMDIAKQKLQLEKDKLKTQNALKERELKIKARTPKGGSAS